METKEDAPTGSSFQRFLRHQGVVIITRNQLALKNSIFFLPTVFFSFLLIVSMSMLLSQDFNSLCGGLLGIAFFSIPILRQCIPYQQQIPLKEILEVKTNEARSISGKYSLFTIYLKDKTIEIVTAQNITKDIIELISPHTK